MTDQVTPRGAPLAGESSKELLRLARSIERLGVQRRKFLARVVELEARIREARRLFNQLAQSIGSELEAPSKVETDGQP